MNKEEEREIYVKAEEINLLAFVNSVEHVLEHIEKLKENILDAAADILSDAEDEEEEKYITLSPGMREVIRQSIKRLSRSEHIDGN